MGYAFSIGGIIVFVSFAVVIVIMMITVSRAVGGAKEFFTAENISTGKGGFKKKIRCVRKDKNVFHNV